MPLHPFLSSQVVQAFRHIQVEKIDEYWSGETIQRVVYDFLDSPDAQAIFFREAKVAPYTSCRKLIGLSPPSPYLSQPTPHTTCSIRHPSMHMTMHISKSYTTGLH
jgi:hypothetical protein